MFSIYCDDFQREDHGHYTFVHVAFALVDDLIPCFIEKLKILKEQYNISSHKLHCRVLFNGSDRKRHNIALNNKQVFALYYELYKFILQFPKEYCNFYINCCDYLVGDWNKIQSIKSLEYPSGEQEELLINEETIMLYLEHYHACRFQKPFHGKFYRETGTDKKKIAQNINNQSNRRIIQNFLNHEIPFIDEKYCPNPELYEVADFFAYISGFCLHEAQKKVFRQLNKDQIFKGKTFFEWYNEFLNKECYNVKLFDVKNMKIENGILKPDFS